MNNITSVVGKEVRDSRNKPTLEITVSTHNGSGTFAVPSGASTGSREAKELRDENGGMRTALDKLSTIEERLIGMNVEEQEQIDTVMKELDGTENKSNLGGNTMIGVSIAAAKAAAQSNNVEFFQHLRTLAEITPSRKVPYLYMNYINGGKHAVSPLSFQEHLIVPESESVSESLRIAETIAENLGKKIGEIYGAEHSQSFGDEGGFVIPESDPYKPFDLIQGAIGESGFTNVHISIDAAATSFYNAGLYTVGGKPYSAQTLSELYEQIASQYKLLSIEDPFMEDAIGDFASLQSKSNTHIVGDDLTVTNAKYIEHAATEGAIQAVIIKPNQVGTLTETLAAMTMARKNGVHCIVSHRSGETSDTAIADLAFAFGCFGLKAGALRKPERRVKYERLQFLSETYL